MSEIYIGTWMYGESKGEESFYPAVGSHTSSPEFQAVYWRCVFLFFATSVRHNPEARHLLFTNFERVPFVDGFDAAAFLERIGVETVRVPFSYIPPEGYFGMWRNQFYVFDIIRELSRRLGAEDVALVLDSDCQWVRPADPMAAAVREHGVLTFDAAFPEDEVQHGLTRRDMKSIYEELLGHTLDRVPPYIGGELYAATGAATDRVAAAIDPLWETLLDRFRKGLPKFNEEAQSLSFLYHKLGYESGTADAFIRRIWTGLFSYHTARPEDFALTLWHLPAEKRYGIRYLFGEIRDPASRFWTAPLGDPFRAYLGERLGVPARSLRKLVLDLSVAVPHKLGQKLGHG